MKIQLDTTSKTVKIEEDVKISKLIEVLKKILPNDWKYFTLETHTTITHWSAPIIIREYPTYPSHPTYPWYYSTGDISFKAETNYQLKSGVYNLEA